MSLFFIISMIGILSMFPIHYLSVEHLKFEKKYGKKKGLKISSILGMVSGWGFFLFLFGIWISPQAKFIIHIFEDLTILIPIINYAIPIFHIIVSLPFILISIWLGIIGVKATTLKVSETHHTEKIVTTGIYSIIRHPQYLAAILAHIGISILLSSLYAILITPLIIFYNYIASWKEERELIKEFGKEYEDYKKRVPMFIPKFKKSRKI